MGHDPILTIDLSAIQSAAENVATAREALLAAEAERDDAIRRAHAIARRGDVGRIIAASGLSPARVHQIVDPRP